MKIGNYVIPPNPFRLSSLKDDIEKIYNSYNRELIRSPYKNDVFARLLGYKSSRNGQYWNKIVAMRAYGFLEGRGYVKVSDLAQQLICGTDSQRRDAAEKAFFNIPLWRELYNRYGLKLPKENLWARLISITGCEESEAKRNAELIYDAFSEDAKTLETVKTQTFPELEFTQTSQKGGSLPEFIEIKAGPYFHRLPFTRQGKKIAIETLQLLEVSESESASTIKDVKKEN